MLTRILPLVLGLLVTTNAPAQDLFPRPVPPPPVETLTPLPASFAVPQIPGGLGGPLGQPPGVDPFGAPGWAVQPGQPLAQTLPPPGGLTIYRLYAFQSAEPLYTEDFNEVVTLVRAGLYRFEGPAFFLAAQRGPGLTPVARGVRLSGTHFLTTNPGQDNRGRIEKVMGGAQVQPQPGWVPLYEWYNPQRDLFLYTTDPRGEIAPAVGYRQQGAIGYVIPAK